MREVQLGTLAGLVLAGLLLATVDLTHGVSVLAWTAVIASVVMTSAFLAAALRSSGAHRLGPANMVTFTRASFVSVVAGLVVDALFRPAHVTALTALVATALVLDAVDGHVARRTGSESRVGASFDMETDAYLILLLSIHTMGRMGTWVLGIGLARYAFLAAGLVLPWLNTPVRPSFFRKAVAVYQGVALLVVTAQVIPRPAERAVLGVGLVLLALSFAHQVACIRRSETAVEVVRPSPRVSLRSS